MSETSGSETSGSETSPTGSSQPGAQAGTIAFLGLGHMGGPMAINLVKAGYTVTGFDVVPAALETARAHGIATAETAVEAVAGAAVVLTMLPSGKHLLDAYRGTPGGPGQQGQPGLLDVARPGTLFLDCSTINVDEAREAADLALAAGHRAVDAPVSGGVVGAEAGTLTFMVGALPEDFEAVKPLLEVMGKRVVHCGEHGAGQAAKICNNMILGVTMIATCEAFAHLCVATDCREIHDARSTRDIDWPFIESSDDELFLLRFYPIISAAHPFLNHTVIFLVREDLFHWGLGTYHTQFRHEPRAEPGSPVHINGTNLLHVWKKRVRANRARACMLCELRWPLSCPD
mgnify:CR=1 FL=1